MSDKPVVPGHLAERDTEAIARYYRSAVSDEQALQFADALEEAFRSIGQFPGAGSPRLSQLLAIPDLRSWPVRGFPYLVLYAELESSIEVYRVLHTARDIPESLSETTEE